MRRISVFTDGSSSVFHDSDGYRYGGYSVYFPNREHKSIQVSCKGKKNKVTNQRMELKACLEALKLSLKGDKIHAIIHSDSMYSIKTITEWAPKWQKDGWTRKTGELCNLDIIMEIMDVYNETINKGNIIDFVHVRAHQKEPKGDGERFIWRGNYMADKLANDAMNNRRNQQSIRNQPPEIK